MKFHWDKGLILIELKLEYDGHKYTIPNCIIDTGSAITAIEIDLINFKSPCNSNKKIVRYCRYSRGSITKYQNY